MSLLWIEGFESFGSSGTATGIASKYLTIAESQYTIQAGRKSGQSCRFGTSTSLLVLPYLGTIGTVVVGFGLLQDAFTNPQAIFVFRDSSAVQITVQIQTDGKLKFFVGSIFGTLLGTTSIGLSASVWTYVEIKIKFDGSTGTLDCKFDGSSVLSLSGQNTTPSGNSVTRLQLFGSVNSADHTTFDDLYVLDTTGSRNNDFLGPRVIKIMTPSSDAGTNQFTTNSGSTHYDRVNNAPNDGDTTYVEDGTSGHKELFGHGACGMASVDGVQMNTVARGTDATVVNLVNTLHSGSDSDGSNQPVAGTDYVTLSRVVETDPNTSAAWLPSAVDSAQFGFKVG